VRTKRLRVLDLMDPGVRRALGVSEQDLIGDALMRCQEIAQYARNAGYDAILAPSAALERTLTLAIFASAAQKVTEQHSHIGRPPPRTRHSFHECATRHETPHLAADTFCVWSSIAL
jgi:RES domain-containing protein